MPRRPNRSRQTQALLAALAEQPRTWQHGYDLAKQTALKSGTLYPLLIRLDGQKLLESRWEPPEIPGRPPRHAYRLTSAGLAFARKLEAPEEKRLPRRSAVTVTA